MNSLVIKDISFGYKKSKVINNLNLQLNSGLNVLLGSNGSGKTTLIKLLVTIYNPDGGSISFNNISYKNETEIKKHISYVPQVFDGYKNLKVSEYLDFMNSFNKTKDKIQIDELSFDVGKYSNKKLKELSEGMKKKVLIVGALLMGSDIIILDEPTSGLDKIGREELKNILVKVSENNPDMIILYSTHIEEDIAQQVSKIVELSNGEIDFEGTYKEYKGIN